MLVQAITWNRDKKDLFNYLSTNHKTSEEMSSSNNLNIYSTTNSVSSSESDSDSHLFCLYFSENKLMFPTPLKQVLIPLRPEKDSYRISEGDTIFLGNIKLKVREISFSNNKHIEGDVLSSEFTNSGVAAPPKPLRSIEKSSDYCRICLQEEEMYNPVIKVCKCSVGIHIVCLRTWLNNKVIHESFSNASVFRWNEFKCEICKDKYPSSVLIDDKKYDLIPIIKPIHKYIVFESNADGKMIIVAAFRNKKKLVIGSNNNSDICIKAHPISSFHSVLRANHDTVTIEDTRSRYGTLVKLGKNIVIDSSIRIQCQNRFFKIKKKTDLKKSSTWRVLGCLGRLSKNK